MNTDSVANKKGHPVKVATFCSPAAKSHYRFGHLDFGPSGFLCRFDPGDPLGANLLLGRLDGSFHGFGGWLNGFDGRLGFGRVDFGPAQFLRRPVSTRMSNFWVYSKFYANFIENEES